MPAYSLKSFAFTSTLCCEAFSVLPGRMVVGCEFNEELDKVLAKDN
jgi:hypothetical protein